MEKLIGKWYIFVANTKKPKPSTPTSKMNITLNISQVNFKKNLPREIQVFSEEELQQFGQGAIIKKQKEYFMVINHRQFIIQCPVLQMDDGSYQVIWPSFKLPNRPYPVYVYLYAAAWYLSSGESMRAAAQKAMRVFGLEHKGFLIFYSSHSGYCSGLSPYLSMTGLRRV
ncbi:MAG: hypothetical protein KGZ79_08035 [Dethiobacter sp.]|nr:hypothetical protein [Dethiobacter sp.]